MKPLPYMQLTLAPSTTSVYHSAWNSYLHFCESTSLVSLPLSQSTLMFYVTSIARRLAYKSIKVYLCGIQFHSNVLGFTQQISHMQQLYYIMRGIRRHQGASRIRLRRPAITITHLTEIMSYITDSSYCPHDKFMLRATVTLTFFALLR